MKVHPEWIEGGRLLVTIIVATFFTVLFTAFAWLCYIAGGWYLQNIAFPLIFIGLFSLYSFIASLVLFIKGKEVGYFE